jgi:hypothetical protein
LSRNWLRYSLSASPTPSKTHPKLSANAVLCLTPQITQFDL